MRRRRSFRASMPRQVIQSYKKVLNFAPTSIAAGSNSTYNVAIGEDSIAAGQTSATDNGVPTGSVIKFVEFQYSTSNLVSISSFVWFAIEHLRSGQSIVDPRAVGGDPQRNQVHFQLMKSTGKEQNNNFTFRFKVPKRFQRVREGDVWTMVVHNDQISTAAMQVIYKFYR